MAKMIKILYEAPADSAVCVERMSSEVWPPSAEILTSFNYISSKIMHDSSGENPGYRSQTVLDDDNTQRVTRYYCFDDYPAETPENLPQWFWRTRRKLDAISCWDTEVEVTDPLDATAKTTVRYNLFQKWNIQYRIKDKIATITFEEVEYNFPTS